MLPTDGTSLVFTTVELPDSSVSPLLSLLGQKAGHHQLFPLFLCRIFFFLVFPRASLFAATNRWLLSQCTAFEVNLSVGWWWRALVV